MSPAKAEAPIWTPKTEASGPVSIHRRVATILVAVVAAISPAGVVAVPKERVAVAPDRPVVQVQNSEVITTLPESVYTGTTNEPDIDHAKPLPGLPPPDHEAPVIAV